MPSPPIPRVTIVGTGAMGTLCAILLANRGSKVTLWGRSSGQVAALTRDRENRRYLSGYALPESVHVVSEPAAAFDNPSLIVSAVPCQFTRPVWERLAGDRPPDVPIVSVAKGLEVGTLLRPTGIIADVVGTARLACLSGPSIAPELAEGKPATVVVAVPDASIARLVQDGFSTSCLRVYASEDLLGVELAGAVKNVIALAAGLCDGLDLGDNAKASLITRGLVEITRLGLAMGASVETFRGLAGVGDLVTTCVSKIGRNRSAGERIGRGETADQIVASTNSVIEGIPTTRSVLQLAALHNVEMPIVSAVGAALFGGRQPKDVISDLMTRPLGSE